MSGVILNLNCAPRTGHRLLKAMAEWSQSGDVMVGQPRFDVPTNAPEFEFLEALQDAIRQHGAIRGLIQQGMSDPLVGTVTVPIYIRA
jgi:hypothetical protein